MLKCVRAVCLFLAWGVAGVAWSAPTTRPAPKKPKVPFSGVCAPSVSSAIPRVQWAPITYAQAMKRAKKTGCPLLIDMYATWCYPCKRYDREVFNQHFVSQFVHQYFIPLRRDGTKGEGRMLTKKYNCVTYPCILVVGPDGKEVERITGFLGTASFVSRLSEIRNNKETLASLLPKLKARPKDAILHYRVGRRLAYRGDARCVKHLLYTANHPPQTAPWLAPRALYVLGRIYYRNTKRDCVSMMAIFQTYLKRFPRGKKRKRVVRLMRWCQRRMRRR